MTLSRSYEAPTGTWMADPVHSDVSFRVGHMGIGRVRGNFTLASAGLIVAVAVAMGGATASGVRAVVDAPFEVNLSTGSAADAIEITIDV